MNYYHNLITDRSFKLLQNLREKYKFILIGGWAVFLYTGALKSKDIDLVVEFEEYSKFRQDFEVNKNARLKKYEAKFEGIDIDIYLPYCYNGGLRAEDLKKITQKLEGFTVCEKEVLAILKQRALNERAGSVKGRKDLIDLVSLFRLPDFDWDKYNRLISDYKVGELAKFCKNIISKTSNISELALNVHKMARLKKRILPLI